MSQLNSEKIFALSINNYLNNNGANWKIIKSEFKFCYLDFLLINLNNLYAVYIEYKERNYALGYKSYDSYFISLRKFYAIKKNYKNTYIIFDFSLKTNNENDFFFIKYDEKAFSSFEKDFNKNRLLIPSNYCKTGFDNLMIELVDIIPNQNLI